MQEEARLPKLSEVRVLTAKSAALLRERKPPFTLIDECAGKIMLAANAGQDCVYIDSKKNDWDEFCEVHKQLQQAGYTVTVESEFGHHFEISWNE